MATKHYTEATGTPETVKVAEFRNEIEHLEQLVFTDFHACVGSKERDAWAFSARRVGTRLINMVCKRATERDMDRRERAIERSTVLLTQVHGL